MSFSFENNSNEVIQKMEDMYQSMTKRKRNHKETRLVAVNHSFHYEIKLFFDNFIGQYKTIVMCPHCHKHYYSNENFFFLDLLIPQSTYMITIKFFRFGVIHGSKFLKEFAIRFTHNITCYELKRKVLSKRKSKRVLPSDNIEIVLLDKEKKIERIINDNDEYIYDYLTDDEYEICAYEKEKGNDNIYCYLCRYEKSYSFFGLIPYETISYIRKYPIAISVSNESNVDYVYSTIKNKIINKNTKLADEYNVDVEKAKMNIGNYTKVNQKNESYFNFSLYLSIYDKHSISSICDFCGIYIGNSSIHSCSFINRFSNNQLYSTIKKSIIKSNIPLILNIELSNKLTVSSFNDNNNHYGYSIVEDIDVYDCLNSFFAGEIIDNETKIFCSNCNTKQDIVKKSLITIPPYILMLRFKSEKEFADFPFEDLNMKEYMLDEYKKVYYDLYAVSKKNKEGKYTTLCRYKNEWYQYNNAMLSKQINEEDFSNNSDYVLFYKLKNVI